MLCTQIGFLFLFHISNQARRAWFLVANKSVSYRKGLRVANFLDDTRFYEIRLPLNISPNIQLWFFFSDCSTTVTCNACPTNREHHHSTRLQSPKWYIVTGLCPSGHDGRPGRRPTAFGRCCHRGSQVWHWVKFLKNTSNPPGPPCPPRDLTSFKRIKNNRAKSFIIMTILFDRKEDWWYIWDALPF